MATSASLVLLVYLLVLSAPTIAATLYVLVAARLAGTRPAVASVTSALPVSCLTILGSVAGVAVSFVLALAVLRPNDDPTDDFGEAIGIAGVAFVMLVVGYVLLGSIGTAIGVWWAAKDEW